MYALSTSELVRQRDVLLIIQNEEIGENTHDHIIRGNKVILGDPMSCSIPTCLCYRSTVTAYTLKTYTSTARLDDVTPEVFDLSLPFD